MPVTGGRLAPLRRALDVWGFTAGFTAPHRDLMLRAGDGVRLAASLLPGPAGPPATVPAVVVAPGFGAHRRKPAYVRLAEGLTAQAAVLAVDPRGHGDSEGVCTLGDREALDVVAAARWLLERGHRWVVAVGASMGGVAVLRAAAGDAGVDIDAVCAISVPAVWGVSDTRAARALARIVARGWYRGLAGAALRVRITRTWADVDEPLDLVGRVAPRPLLLVHGADDHFFAPEHARRLYDGAGGPCTLWLEPAGFGHAEDGLNGAFVDRLAAAVATCRRTGRWPPTRSVSTDAR
ncbi:MAG: alpha/beta fold hydrolase [Actinomycetota bacterium]|nr:alpha/beta fold hydrolase [Actinomycetota bacterium]